MPGAIHNHTFEGLAEFREVLPQLARASNHDVYVDVGSTYAAGRTSPNDAVKVDRQAVWNNRDDRLAYLGSDGYTITQHEEILKVIDDAVGETVGEIDIGRIRDYGSRIDGLVTLNGHNVDVSELCGDGYVPPESEIMSDRSEEFKGFGQHDGTVRDILGVGVRFGNSFDGSERIRFQTMGYRYICQNWMVWGEEEIGRYSQLHVDELQVEDIEELIFDVIDKKDDLSILVEDAVEQEIEMSWVPGLLEEVGFGARYQKRIITELLQYTDVETDGTCNRWQLYNAITSHLDHDVALEVNANVYDRHQNKAAKFLMNDAEEPEELVTDDELLEIVN